MTSVPVSFLHRFSALSSRSGSSLRNLKTANKLYFFDIPRVINFKSITAIYIYILYYFSSVTARSISFVSTARMDSCRLGNRSFNSATVLLKNKRNKRYMRQTNEKRKRRRFYTRINQRETRAVYITTS